MSISGYFRLKYLPILSSLYSMKKFLAITAFKDTGDKYRRRNLQACMRTVFDTFPEADHLVIEQGNGEWFSTLEAQADHVLMEDTGSFRKSSLLNRAVFANPGYSGYVMVDADVYFTRKLADYVIANTADNRLVFPYGDTIYLDEVDTKRLVTTGTIFRGDKDHGVTLRRQTGLCNSFTWDTFNAVAGFDEEFTGWGAEDDTFMFKFRRIGAEILRNPDPTAAAFHMFHPKVNTDAYLESPNYRRNRVMCACVRRMSDEDFSDYLAKKVSMEELVDKYKKMGRLEIQLIWEIVRGTTLHIDTTIYDIDRSGKMDIDKILTAVYNEDGAAGIVEFVDDVLSHIPNMPPEITGRIAAWYGRTREECAAS